MYVAYAAHCLRERERESSKWTNSKLNITCFKRQFVSGTWEEHWPLGEHVEDQKQTKCDMRFSQAKHRRRAQIP